MASDPLNKPVCKVLPLSALVKFLGVFTARFEYIFLMSSNVSIFAVSSLVFNNQYQGFGKDEEKRIL